MNFKITGTTVLCAIALVCGFLMVRDELRQRLVGMLQDTDKYAVFPESEPLETNFEGPFDFTMTEPVLPSGVMYNPEE